MDIQRNYLRNLCKFATLYVKGSFDKWWTSAFKKGDLEIPVSMDSAWFRRMLDAEYSPEVSQMLSMARYHDCVVDRLKEKGDEIFEEILSGINIRF